MKTTRTKYGTPLETNMHVRLTLEQRTKLDEYARLYCGENISYALRKAIDTGLRTLLPEEHENT